jgi:class 3 adenylate cyclase
VGGDLREERRVVTAMFADLAGSTALAERLVRSVDKVP